MIIDPITKKSTWLLNNIHLQQRRQQCGSRQHEARCLGLQPRGERQREAEQNQPGQGRPRPEEVYQGDSSRHRGKDKPRAAWQCRDSDEEPSSQRGERLVEPREARHQEAEGPGRDPPEPESLLGQGPAPDQPGAQAPSQNIICP